MTFTKGLGLLAILLLCISLAVQSHLDSSKTDLASALPGTLTSNKSADQLPRQQPINWEQRWFISAPEAQQLVSQGATLLDGRGAKLGQARLPGAQTVSWEQFSPKTDPGRGRLLADDALLSEKLQALGFSAARPVVVVGDPLRGWGEEGRIVWMLRTLGHPKAVMVDGGVAALEQAGFTASALAMEGPGGDFVVQRRATWDIQRAALKAQLDAAQSEMAQATRPILVDTREAREFAGQTPYGERRGGHLPGAVHLHFKTLLAPDGKLLPEAAIAQKLTQLGITRDRPIIVYCTGGIRSGWLAAVLISQGYAVQNYAGSMWEWSAAPADQYPLSVP